MKYDLDQTWELTLKMWKWIDEQVDAGSEATVTILKKKWMSDNNFENIRFNCFFCEYDSNSHCRKCPGKVVDNTFDCSEFEYGYARRPREFYAKLLELDKIRKAK